MKHISGEFVKFEEHNTIRKEPKRLVNIDAIRGLGILLILISNIQEFALPRAGYFFPSIYGDFSLLNRLAWHFDDLFCNEKSLIIFGLLFGASLVLAGRTGPSPTLSQWKRQLRRTLFLILVGLAHSYFVWDGDILVTLAVCGFIAYPFRRFSVQSLVLMSILFVVIIPLGIGFLNAGTNLWHLEKIACFDKHLTGPPGTLKYIIEHLHGGFLAQLEYRIPASLIMHRIVLPYQLLWYVSGSMFLGMALLKSGFLTGDFRPRLYRLTLAGGAIIGLPLTHLNLHHIVLTDLPNWLSFYYASQYEWWVGLTVAGAWISVVILAAAWRQAQWITGLLANVGRLSLTNYLGQSLICTTLFFGHGFKLYGQLDRIHLLGIVVIIWLGQIVFSAIWLKWCPWGPAEWAMRTWSGYVQPKCPRIACRAAAPQALQGEALIDSCQQQVPITDDRPTESAAACQLGHPLP